ncbi:298_t:CDS:1, partial [Racocetra fulgida]
ISIPNLLGLTVIQNANYLQQKISERFSYLYPNFEKILKAQKNTNQLQNGVKKCGQKLVENLNSTKLVKAGLLCSSDRMLCDPISFQELAIELKKNQNKLYQKTRQLKRSKAAIKKNLSLSDLDNESQKIQLIINNLLQIFFVPYLK